MNKEKIHLSSASKFATPLLIIGATLSFYSCVQLPGMGGDGQPCNSAGVCMPGYECKAEICVKSQNPFDGGNADGGTGADGGTAYSEWIDQTTGYWWQDPSAETVMTWQEAITYCENLVLVGESDWRLPSISELRSFIRGCDLRSSTEYCNVADSCLDSNSCWSPTTCMHCYGGGAGPGKNGCFWDPEISGDCSQHPWYWSSSTVANSSGSAWAVIFSSGYVRYDVKTPTYSVRCVRGP